MLPLDTIYHMDALELLKQLPDGCIDMILCDLPYGTTACAWDEIIPFEPMWEGFKRLIKPRGAIVLTASQPFTSKLICSNLDMYGYSWIWNKSRPSGFLDANRKPLNDFEDIAVFYHEPTQYFPQMSKGQPNHIKHGSISNSKRAAQYQYYKPVPSRLTDEKFPRRVLKIDSLDPSQMLHPTQKPVALFEYLIRTYTQAGEIILDPCVGSGTTAIAARQTGRQFICGDRELQYVNIARERLAKPYTEPMFVE